MRHECKDSAECWFWWVGTWIAADAEIPERNDTIMNELYDFHFLLSGLAEFYDEITGGLISKPNTNKFEIVGLVEERMEREFQYGYDAAKEEIEEWHECATD